MFLDFALNNTLVDTIVSVLLMGYITGIKAFLTLKGIHLRTFAPIDTAHLYCARYSLSTHVPRHFQAHALSRKLNKNIELVTLALTWCANIFVGCSVIPTFFFCRSLPFLILSSILKNKKNLCEGSFNYFS